MRWPAEVAPRLKVQQILALAGRRRNEYFAERISILGRGSLKASNSSGLLALKIRPRGFEKRWAREVIRIAGQGIALLTNEVALVDAVNPKFLSAHLGTNLNDVITDINSLCC